MYCGLTQTELTRAASIKACILIIPERKKSPGRGGHVRVHIKLSFKKKMCFHLKVSFDFYICLCVEQLLPVLL